METTVHYGAPVYELCLFRQGYGTRRGCTQYDLVDVLTSCPQLLYSWMWSFCNLASIVFSIKSSLQIFDLFLLVVEVVWVTVTVHIVGLTFHSSQRGFFRSSEDQLYVTNLIFEVTKSPINGIGITSSSKTLNGWFSCRLFFLKAPLDSFVRCVHEYTILCVRPDTRLYTLSLGPGYIVFLFTV